jgi:serine acetyltransferase
LCVEHLITQIDSYYKKGTNIMKLLKQVIIVPLLLIAAGASVAADLLFTPAYIAGALKGAEKPLLLHEVNNPTIYSGAAITTGAGSSVGGGIRAYQAVTLGANSKIGDALVAGAGVTVGAGGSVGRFVTAGDGATTGADVVVGDWVVAGDAIVLGASTTVDGDATAGKSVTLGHSAIVDGDVTASTTFVTLVGNSRVLADSAKGTGIVRAGTTINESASSIIESGERIAPQLTPFTRPKRVNYQAEVALVQSALRNMPITNTLAATIGVNTILYPGVYSAADLTTAASITLTLDGRDENVPAAWVFNIDTYLSFGASLIVRMINTHPDSTVVWNTVGYTFIGAQSKFIGSIIAGSYVTTGAGTTIDGVDTGVEDGLRCGGIITRTGGVTLGADNVVGGDNCLKGSLNKFIEDYHGNAVFDPDAEATPEQVEEEEGCADDEIQDYYGDCYKGLPTKQNP